MSGSFCSRFSIAVRPPSSAPSVTSWPTIRGSDSSPILALSPTSIAEALEEALVALHVDRDPVRVEVEHRDLGLLALLLELRLRPLADQQPGLVVVGRERRVGGVGRLGRRVERDHQQPRLARLVERRHDRLGVARRDQEALRAGRDQVLDRGDLALVVAVLLARERLQLRARLAPPALGALLHLHEERVRLGLGDQTDLDRLTTTTAAPARARLIIPAASGHTNASTTADPTAASLRGIPLTDMTLLLNPGATRSLRERFLLAIQLPARNLSSPLRTIPETIVSARRDASVSVVKP